MARRVANIYQPVSLTPNDAPITRSTSTTRVRELCIDTPSVAHYVSLPSLSRLYSYPLRPSITRFISPAWLYNDRSLCPSLFFSSLFFFVIKLSPPSIPFFFFNDPAPPEISPLPLPDPLPI